MARASALEAWIETLSKQFADRMLDIGETTMECWAELPTERTLPVIDSLLAATAVEHSLVVATRNTKDFAGLGIEIVNPFEGGADAKPA